MSDQAQLKCRIEIEASRPLHPTPELGTQRKPNVNLPNPGIES